MRNILLLKSVTPFAVKLPALGLAAIFVFLFGGAPQSLHSNASTPGVVTFDAPGAGTTSNSLQGTAAFGINASGEVVGANTDSNGVHHGIVRTADGTITQFDAPGAGTSGNQGTLAIGINTAGDVTGYYTDARQTQHGYVRTADGTITTFDIIGTAQGYNKGVNAFAINDSGTIAGQVYEQVGTFAAGESGRAWLPSSSQRSPHDLRCAERRIATEHRNDAHFHQRRGRSSRIFRRLKPRLPRIRPGHGWHGHGVRRA